MSEVIIEEPQEIYSIQQTHEKTVRDLGGVMLYAGGCPDVSDFAQYVNYVPNTQDRREMIPA